MKHIFLEKFFLASRIASIRKEICGISHRRSIDGQDTSSSKASDLQHGKQHIAIWSQRAESIPIVGAASNQRLENQLTELTTLVRQLAVGQHQPALATKVCGICTSVEHPTNMCPHASKNRVGPARDYWSSKWISVREATVSESAT
ncbi:hypothetical protein CR513_01234, partial [Mucuna pruriens]